MKIIWVLRIMVIFLLEDNPGDIYLISEFLKEMNLCHDLMVITNGNSAINHITNIEIYPNQHIPDLMILDIKMPSIDGLEILAIAKKNHKLKNTAITILTGHNDPRVKEIALQMGAAGYFVKSTDPAEYRKTLEQIILLVKDKK